MNKILRFFEKYIIPKSIYRFCQPIYHYLLAFSSSAIYGRPSKKLTVIGVTGTKGKSSFIYFLGKIFEEAGYKVAVTSSIQFKIGKNEWTNNLKMTMPGRSMVQKFLSDAVRAGCQYAIVEVTSQGVTQHRHQFIDFDTAVFTNLAPEHIESHGSFEAYKNAKLEFFRYVKNNHVLNKDDEHFEEFFNIPAQNKYLYSLKDAKDLKMKLVGDFNARNGAAAIKTAALYGVDYEIAKRAIEKIDTIPGRMEFISEGQDFKVVVDYAHTPDSLTAAQEALAVLKPSGSRLICVLGAAGGGRDKWKRPEMGKIAAHNCDEMILTNEDPYDENPLSILEDIAKGFSKSDNVKFQMPGSFCKMLDRREAIRKALNIAKKDDIVIITGKGSEPLMMLDNGKKIEWDDRQVVREEIKALYDHRKLL